MTRPNDRSRELGLQPATQRWARIVGVFLLGLAAASAVFGDPAARTVGAAVWAVAGMLLLTRVPKLGVTLRDSDMTVRGVFRSRTIPRAQIVDITSWPAVEWITPTGHRRFSPINAFAMPSTKGTAAEARQERYDNQCVVEIRNWLPGRRKRPE